MSSLRQKLSRLGPLGGSAMAPPSSGGGEHGAPSADVGAAAPQVEALASSKPGIDELRDRIASILARSQRQLGTRVAQPSLARPGLLDVEATLPFVEEPTPLGPLHLARKTSSPAARVGQAPLHPAVLADPGMLALLALDPTLASCDPRRALYLDAETTGLSGGTGTVAFLLGLAFFDDHEGAFVLEQVLVKDLGEEAPMLEHLARRLDDASMVVTFNGKTFDWPLLRTRAVMNRRPPLRELPHLDLLHVARRIHKARLASCNLRTIEEEVLGSVRIDDVGGADVAACYMHYLRTRDASALSGVVEHNALDVLSMIALAGFYGEPVGSLGPLDLSRVASTLRRAGALDRAQELADLAALRLDHLHDATTEARVLRVRGDIAKARGDKARALGDYERALAAESDPALRLELAKLYEHFEKSFDKALVAIAGGTSEAPQAHERRRARLVRRLEVKGQPDEAPKRTRARRSS
jgi:uncharacterized protein YprB with RNaseH-like and TPR domain